MRCASQCYEIGGPWIAEDPNCPIHGHEARAAREEAEASASEMERRIEDLERRVRRLEDKVLD